MPPLGYLLKLLAFRNRNFFWKSISFVQYLGVLGYSCFLKFLLDWEVQVSFYRLVTFYIVPDF